MPSHPLPMHMYFSALGVAPHYKIKVIVCGTKINYK